jgi:hypothetical protein
MGLTVLKTPARCPQANAFCERLIGTFRPECLDWMIVLNEQHLRIVLKEWVAHDHQGVPMRASVRGFPTWRRTNSRSQTGITSPPATTRSPHRSWADCITTITGSRWRLDRASLLPASIFADDRFTNTSWRRDPVSEPYSHHRL